MYSTRHWARPVDTKAHVSRRSWPQGVYSLSRRHRQVNKLYMKCTMIWGSRMMKHEEGVGILTKT